jgi:hypothetical protein
MSPTPSSSCSTPTLQKRVPRRLQNFNLKSFLDSFDLSLDMNRLRRPTDLRRLPQPSLRAGGLRPPPRICSSQASKSVNSTRPTAISRIKNRSKQSMPRPARSPASPSSPTRSARSSPETRRQAEKRQLFSGDLYEESAKLVHGTRREAERRRPSEPAHSHQSQKGGAGSPIPQLLLHGRPKQFWHRNFESKVREVRNQACWMRSWRSFLTQASHLFSSGEQLQARNDRASILNLVGAINECSDRRQFRQSIERDQEGREDARCRQLCRNYDDSVVNGISFYV